MSSQTEVEAPRSPRLRARALNALAVVRRGRPDGEQDAAQTATSGVTGPVPDVARSGEGGAHRAETVLGATGAITLPPVAGIKGADARPTTPVSPFAVVPELARHAADLAALRPPFTQAVHERLLQLVPELGPLPGGGWGCAERLVIAAVHGLGGRTGSPPSDAAAVARQVGAANALDGFPLAQWGQVTHALLHAARTVDPEQWSSTLSSAWVEYLLWLQPHLVAGASAGAAMLSLPDNG